MFLRVHMPGYMYAQFAKKETERERALEGKKQKTRIAKEYLSRIRKTDQMIRRLCDAKFSLRESLYSTGGSLAGGTGKPKAKDKTGDIIARIDELERRIDAYVDELVTRKAETFEKIRGMDDLNEQNILIARYIQLKSWKQIAREMHYSEQQIYRLHGMALQHFQVQGKDESK